MHNSTNSTPITNEENIVFYNLEKIRFVIKDGTGLDIAYAYEDLVFSEHAIFIIQFDGNSESKVNCWFNSDCNHRERESLLRSLTTSAHLNQLQIDYKGIFTMTQTEGAEEISLTFAPIE